MSGLLLNNGIEKGEVYTSAIFQLMKVVNERVKGLGELLIRDNSEKANEIRAYIKHSFGRELLVLASGEDVLFNNESIKAVNGMIEHAQSCDSESWRLEELFDHISAIYKKIGDDISSVVERN